MSAVTSFPGVTLASANCRAVTPAQCLQIYRFLSEHSCLQPRWYRDHRALSLHLAGRLLLAYMLQHYSETPYDTAVLLYGTNGKPYFEGSMCPYFSISHSGDRACVALAQAPVGLDYQKMVQKRDLPAIAARYFSKEECRAYHKAPCRKRLSYFYRIWTLKESYLKYTGEGMRRPLQSFSLVPGTREAVMSGITDNISFGVSHSGGYSLSLCLPAQKGTHTAAAMRTIRAQGISMKKLLRLLV